MRLSILTCYACNDCYQSKTLRGIFIRLEKLVYPTINISRSFTTTVKLYNTGTMFLMQFARKVVSNQYVGVGIKVVYAQNVNRI